MLSFFPLDVIDEIWDLIEAVSEGFLTYSSAISSLSLSKGKGKTKFSREKKQLTLCKDRTCAPADDQTLFNLIYVSILFYRGLL